MRRAIRVGAAVGAIGPIVVAIELGLHRFFLPDGIALVLFPLSIVTMGVEHLPLITQWMIYVGLSLLNVVLFAGFGVCVGFAMRVLKR